MNFSEFYLVEKKMSISRRIANLFTSMKKYDLNVDKLSSFKEVSEGGYDKIVDKLAEVVEIDDWRKKKASKLDFDKRDDKVRRDYLKKYKLKVEDRITEIYKGILQGSNDLIPLNYNPQDISVYESNRGGIVALLSLSNKDSTKFYIGVDNKGDRFFKSVIGMSFDTYSTLNKPKSAPEVRYKSTTKVDKEPEEVTSDKVKETNYIEKLESVKDTIRDSNDNWYGFIKLSESEYNEVLSKLKALQKKGVPFITKNIGTIYKFEITPEDVLYAMSIKNINNLNEYYIIYEVGEENTKYNSIKDLNKLLFGKFKWDDESDVHWIRNLDISKLPSF